jgi:chromosome segregation ATPase
MEESEASRLEKMMSLESELVALRAALNDKEEYLVTIQTELSTLKEDLQGKDEMILALQSKPEQVIIVYVKLFCDKSLRLLVGGAGGM